MVDRNTKANEHNFYEMHPIFCFTECQQNIITIPPPSVVLRFPLIQKECHLYLLQG